VFQGTEHPSRPAAISHQCWQRLQGFYGPELDRLLASGPLEPVTPDRASDLLWAELCWACRREDVQHLDDLLLRRTRLGMVLPNAGEALLPQIRNHCQPLLGWADQRWEEEQARYLSIYHNAYSLPPQEASDAS